MVSTSARVSTPIANEALAILANPSTKFSFESQHAPAIARAKDPSNGGPSTLDFQGALLRWSPHYRLVYSPSILSNSFWVPSPEVLVHGEVGIDN